MRQLRRSYPSAGTRANSAQTPVFGLIFPSNVAAGSDIRLVWDGANLLSRTVHTAIWKCRFIQQNSYYAWAWHAHNSGTFGSDTYEYGCHPYPSATGTVDGNGQNTDVTSQSGGVHYFEIAGLGGHDYLASPGEAATLVEKGVWYTQARVCEVIGGTTLRHTFYLDLDNDPTKVIVQDILLSNLAAAGSTPAFYFGASDWRSGQGGAGRNDETPSGTYRHLLLYNAALTLEQIEEKASRTTDDTGDPNVWYSCINPRPTDITDKSGANHTPSWANANRPTEYAA